MIEACTSNPSLPTTRDSLCAQPIALRQLSGARGGARFDDGARWEPPTKPVAFRVTRRRGTVHTPENSARACDGEPRRGGVEGMGMQVSKPECAERDLSGSCARWQANDLRRRARMVKQQWRRAQRPESSRVVSQSDAARAPSFYGRRAPAYSKEVRNAGRGGELGQVHGVKTGSSRCCAAIVWTDASRQARQALSCRLGEKRR